MGYAVFEIALTVAENPQPLAKGEDLERKASEKLMQVRRFRFKKNGFYKLYENLHLIKKMMIFGM